jgi:hypothetical protein
LDLAEEKRSLSREVYFFLIFGAEDRSKSVELSEGVDAEVEGKVDAEDVDGRSNRSTKKKSPTWSSPSTPSSTLPHTLLLPPEATKG